MSKVFNKLLELPTDREAHGDRQFVTALARGLEVLRAFQPGEISGSDRYRPSLWLRQRAMLGLPAKTPR